MFNQSELWLPVSGTEYWFFSEHLTFKIKDKTGRVQVNIECTDIENFHRESKAALELFEQLFSKLNQPLNVEA